MNNELQLQVGPYRTTFVGTEIIRKSTKKEWENYGEILRRVDEAKQWAIGDWLSDGKSHYGDGLYEKAAEILGIEEQSLRRSAMLANQFELLHRCNNLSWTHYLQVSSIKTIETKNGKMFLSKNHDMKKAQEFLNRAEKEKLSVRDLRKIIEQYLIDQENICQLANEPKKYQVIYADPPWPVGSIEMEKWESPIEDKYPIMQIDEIKSLPIGNITGENCSLFLWTTHTFIHDALHIMDFWGFKYFCTITWDKGNGWTQNGFNKRTEFLLYGYKGKINIDQFGESIPTIIVEQKKEHSKKPDMIREMINNKVVGSKIELFARNKYEGWDSWGQEI